MNWIVVVYLVSIVIANLLVASFGPSVSILIAFVFIGLDLTLRDALHEKWAHRNLFVKMLLLIATGSLLSYLVNREAQSIAFASFVAFMCASTVDFAMYVLLGQRSKALKVNGSNVVGASVDSLVFPALAFGFPLLIPIVIGQFLAKTVGGFVWYLVLRGIKRG